MRIISAIQHLGFTVKKDGFFDTQIIVTKDLNAEEHIWLTSLTRYLSQSAAQRLADKITKLHGKLEKNLGASVLEISIRAAKNQIQNKEDKTMIDCPALNELFEPKLQKACTQARDDLLKEKILKKLLKNKSAEVIAAELEEDDIDKIRRLINEISRENASNTTGAGN